MRDRRMVLSIIKQTQQPTVWSSLLHAKREVPVFHSTCTLSINPTLLNSTYTGEIISDSQPADLSRLPKHYLNTDCLCHTGLKLYNLIVPCYATCGLCRAECRNSMLKEKKQRGLKIAGFTFLIYIRTCCAYSCFKYWFPEGFHHHLSGLFLTFTSPSRIETESRLGIHDK